MGYFIRRIGDQVIAFVNGIDAPLEFDFKCLDMNIIRMYPHLPVNPHTTEYNELLFIHGEAGKYIYYDPDAFDHPKRIKTLFHVPVIYEFGSDIEPIRIGDFVNGVALVEWRRKGKPGYSFCQLDKSSFLLWTSGAWLYESLEENFDGFFFGHKNSLTSYVKVEWLDALRMFQLIDFDNQREIKKNYNYRRLQFLTNEQGVYSKLEFNNQLPTSSEVGLLIPPFMTVRGATTNRYKDYSSLSCQTIDDFDYETGLALVCTEGKYAFINKYFLPVTNWCDEIISHQDIKSKYGIDDDSFDIGDKSVFYVRKAGVVEKIKTGGDLFKMYSVKPDSFYKHSDTFKERWGFVYGNDRYDIGIDGDGLIIPHLDVAIIENYWEYDSVEDEIELLNMEVPNITMENENHNRRIIDYQFLFRNAQKLDQNDLLEALAIHKRDNGEIPCGYRILRSWEIEESLPPAH